MRKIITSPFFIVVVVWILFSFPYFFLGKVPFPSSYQVNFFAPWNAYSEFASPYKNEATPDVIGQIYPWREFTIDTWKSGQVPLWNPYSFSGTYHLANYQSAVFSPMNLGFFIFPFIEWWSIMILFQPLLAGIFVLLYARSLKFSYPSQIISSIAFMFCGFITTWMMYGTLGYAILFLPLALFAIEKYLTAGSRKYLLLLFLTIPFSFFSGHFQISIYFLLFILYYLIFRGFTFHSRRIVYLLVGIFFGLLASAIQLLPSIEAYSQSLRSGIFQKIETIPWMYLPTFIAPDFYGNPVTRNAWFGHYAEWNAFIGIIPLFFAFYAFFRIKTKEVLIFAIPFFISIFLAFSSPFLDLLILLKIPVLSTSAASRIIVLFSFSAAILCGYGIAFFIQDIYKRSFKNIFILSSLLFGIFLILWGIVSFKLFLEPDKITIAFSNLRFPSLIFVFFMGLLGCIVFSRNKRVQGIIIIFILILTIFDVLRFAVKWQPFEPKNLVFTDTKISNFYKTLPKNSSRVFKNSGAEGIMHYRLMGTEGYDAVYIKRYGDFISSLKTGNLDTGARSVVGFPKDSPYATSAANLLGIKYIIHKVSDGQNVWEFPFWKYNPESLRLIYDDDKYEILENKNAYPRAFLVDKVIYETNPQKILDTMFSSQTNLKQVAIVEEDFGGKLNLETGSAEIVKYTPNEVSIKTSSASDSFLVLTDSYSPGWNAYVNGQKTKVLRTDFTFRGVFIPKGVNNITFKYEPKSFTYGIYLSSLGFVGIIFLLIISRRKKERI